MSPFYTICVCFFIPNFFQHMPPTIGPVAPLFARFSYSAQKNSCSPSTRGKDTQPPTLFLPPSLEIWPSCPSKSLTIALTLRVQRMQGTTLKAQENTTHPRFQNIHQSVFGNHDPFWGIFFLGKSVQIALRLSEVERMGTGR